jgi:hypothetical protein
MYQEEDLGEWNSLITNAMMKSAKNVPEEEEGKW